MNIASPDSQRRVLQALAKHFNRFVNVEDVAEQVGCTVDELQDMLTLLISNGLVEALDATTMDSSGKEWLSPTITALGMQHADADGGIGKAVSTVNVAFDADTLRALIAARVTDSALPEEEKSKWRSWLASAGDAGLKEAMKHLVEGAIRHWPDALQAMHRLGG